MPDDGEDREDERQCEPGVLEFGDDPNRQAGYPRQHGHVQIGGVVVGRRRVGRPREDNRVIAGGDGGREAEVDGLVRKKNREAIGDESEEEHRDDRQPDR